MICSFWSIFDWVNALKMIGFDKQFMVFERSFIDTWLQGKLVIYDQRFSFLYFYIAWFTSPKSFESFYQLLTVFSRWLWAFDF